jgi:hypothetical protein
MRLRAVEKEVVVEADGLGGGLEEGLVGRGGKARAGREGEAGPVGQQPDRFAKGDLLHAHHKGEDITPLGAGPETPPRLPLGEDEERGGALRVERAEGLIVLARPLQGDIAGYHLNNVQPLP